MYTYPAGSGLNRIGHRPQLLCVSWLRARIAEALGATPDTRGSSLGREESQPRMAILQLEYVRRDCRQVMSAIGGCEIVLSQGADQKLCPRLNPARAYSHSLLTGSEYSTMREFGSSRRNHLENRFSFRWRSGLAAQSAASDRSGLRAHHSDSKRRALWSLVAPRSRVDRGGKS